MSALWTEVHYILTIIMMTLVSLYVVVAFMFFFYNSYIIIGIQALPFLCFLLYMIAFTVACGSTPRHASTLLRECFQEVKWSVIRS